MLSFLLHGKEVLRRAGINSLFLAEHRKPARSLYEGESERAEEEVGESGAGSGVWEGNGPEQLR